MREIKISIPPGTPPARCRRCGRTIYWVTTATGKQMPVDPDGTSHFARCPAAAQFRKSKPRRPRQGELFGGGQG